MRKEEREQSNERQRHKGEERKTRRRGMRRRTGGGCCCCCLCDCFSCQSAAACLAAGASERAAEREAENKTGQSCVSFRGVSGRRAVKTWIYGPSAQRHVHGLTAVRLTANSNLLNHWSISAGAEATISRGGESGSAWTHMWRAIQR